jgi:sulfur relay (sulfurtransferase) DsrF/TusC family protein
MIKLYYDENTGFLCDRYPKNIAVSESTPFLEVSDEEAECTYYCEAGVFWGVKDNKLQLLPDETPEYIKMKKHNEICESQQYLSDTDYVITKLNELRLEDDDEYEEAKAKYANVLTERKAARKRINDIEEELKALDDSSSAETSSK